MHAPLTPIRLLSANLVLLMALFSTTTWADEDNIRDPKLVLNVGPYHINSIATDLLITSGVGATVGLSFENTLSMPSTADVQRFDGYFRYDDRNRIEFSYYGLNRRGQADLGVGGIDIGGTTFVGVTTSDSEATIMKALWSHSYIKDNKYDFGIGGGVYINSSKTTITDSTGPTPNTATADVTVGLPVFSLRGAWHITPKWQIWAKQDLFFLNITDLTSALSDFTFAVEHQTFKHVGFGANVNYFTTTASTTVEGKDAELIRRYSGAMLYAKFVM